jgi:multisubunit Na+/H+ antiporter MnhC subunit
MELTLAAAIGILAGSGVWLILRPRTYQLVIGLSLLSYAVNLFIFSMGRLRVGAAPLLVGDAFLTSYFRYVDLPLVGKIPMATATLFDLGVFGLVVGATVLMLIAIAHQSIRRLRAVRLEEERQLEEVRRQWN